MLENLALAEAESLVRATLSADASLVVAGSIDRDWFTVTITKVPDQVETCQRKQVSIGTAGVELFEVRFDEAYILQEFEYVEAEQRVLLAKLASLAGAYLSGAGRVVRETTLFRRRQRTLLSIEVAAQEFRLQRRRSV